MGDGDGQPPKNQGPLWSLIKVLTALVPLVAAGYWAVHTLLIEPCRTDLAACRESLKTEQARWTGAVPRDDLQALTRERDDLRRQLAASRASVRKIPEVVAYLRDLEAERVKNDRDADLLATQLEQATAAAGAARELCARAEPGADICRSAAQHEAAAKAIPARMESKRKRSEALTQQIEEAMARLGGGS